MKIQSMFRDDINREINGVVQVKQDESDVVSQEIKEYVVTSELKKHFISFFDYYNKSFDTPTNNIGVWITGFFGSGKSHFLKMLSYLLSNKTVNGISTVECFKDKFEDPLAYMSVEKATSVLTETILFNIDIESSGAKDDTAVLRVFARVFYNYLGFYGNDLKVVQLEKFITKQGKMEEFKRVFEEINGGTWEETRKTMSFFGEDVVKTLQNVLGMSEKNAQSWFDNDQEVTISIAELVDDIKEYVDSKPKDFRLLFMIDEVGQYIGTNDSMLLNLQSLTEELGNRCRGKVWIVATGQEALDEIIKLRTDKFSRIMGRFKLQLSLSSSSVGEVIEKRLLIKTEDAKKVLIDVYDRNAPVLKNLYSFDTEVKDIKGYSSQQQFVNDFPFVPYQFIIMQKSYNEIRKHGFTGRHTSDGERSMLSGFQESAQRIQNGNELALVPLYEFYNPLHASLSSQIKSVVERADKAAREGNGLTLADVNLLKILFLIRYVKDIPSTLENLTILMANAIDIDMMILKDSVQKSLDRLVRQNYVSRNGEVYLFLTDEEQDIARDISNQVINVANVIEEIKKTIFEDIYDSKKFKFQNNLFGFEGIVDDSKVSNLNGEMTLRFVTNACDENDRRPERLLLDSTGKVICLMSDSYFYYDKLEQVLKTKKYIKQLNRSQLPESTQNIINLRMNEANRLSKEVREDIEKSIVDGEFFIDGEKVNVSGTGAKNKLNDALEKLVNRIYYALNKIEVPVKDDSEIIQILRGHVQNGLEGCTYNQEAYDEVLLYVDVQSRKKLPTALNNIYDRFQSAPYGWQSNDIMAIVARLMVDSEIDVKCSGMKLSSSDAKTFNYLKIGKENGKISITKHEKSNQKDLRVCREFYKEYANTMDIPTKEEELIQKILECFEKENTELSFFNKNYQDYNYPGQNVVKEAKNLIEQITFSKNDNIAFIKELSRISDDILDNNKELEKVRNFFKNQVRLYRDALTKVAQIEFEIDEFKYNDKVKDAVEEIKKITNVSNNYNFNRIKDLNRLILNIDEERNKVLEAKIITVKSLIQQCLSELENHYGNNVKLDTIMAEARNYFKKQKEEVDSMQNLLALNSKLLNLAIDKDNFILRMNNKINQIDNSVSSVQTKSKSKTKAVYYRNAIFQAGCISSKEDVDNYVEMMRSKLMSLLKDGEEIDLK